MHGSLEDHFLVIRIPWLNKVITYLLTTVFKEITSTRDAEQLAEKDLGVYITDNLPWNKQVNVQCA